MNFDSVLNIFDLLGEQFDDPGHFYFKKGCFQNASFKLDCLTGFKLKSNAWLNCMKYKASNYLILMNGNEEECLKGTE